MASINFEPAILFITYPTMPARQMLKVSPETKIIALRIARNPSRSTAWSSASNRDRKSTRLNSSHEWSSYAVFCLKKKKARRHRQLRTRQRRNELPPLPPRLHAAGAPASVVEKGFAIGIALAPCREARIVGSHAEA